MVTCSAFIGSRHGHFNTDYSMASADLTYEFDNGWQAKFKANAFRKSVDELDLMTLSPTYPDGDRLIVDLSQNVNKDERKGFNLDLSGEGFRTSWARASSCRWSKLSPLEPAGG